MLFFCGVCILLPLVVGAVLYFRFNSLERVKKKYGSLYNTLDLRNGNLIVAAVPTLYLLRRIALAASIVYQNSLLVQILVLFVGVTA